MLPVSYLSEDMLRKTDFVAGVYSGFLDEMVERGIPVVILDIDYPLFHDLSANGIAEMVAINELSDCNKLKLIKNTSRGTLMKRRDIFMEEKGDASKVIMSILRKNELIN